MSAALIAPIIGTLKIGLISAMSIVCGWQPMPDGSASYECVVQVEPQLLDALKRGDSIPLSVDLPAHVQPISRIRLTIGTGDVPQQLLAKSAPSVPKKSLDGVVQTQFTTNNNAQPGYNNQNPGAQVIPANDYVTNAQDAFARSLQNGGQQVRNAVTEMTQDILPPDAGRGVASAVERAGQQLGNNLQNTGETVREDIRQLFGSEPTASDNSEILPPGGQNTARNENSASQQILPNDASGVSNRRRLDQPINSNQIGDWQSRGGATTNPPGTAASTNNQRDTLDRSWQEATPRQQVTTGSNQQQPGSNSGRFSAAPPFSGSESSILPQNNSGQNAPTNSANRYGNYSPPPTAGAATADNRNADAPNNQSASGGPAFPPFTPPTVDQSVTPTPQSSASVAEIRKDMLNQPANAEIQGANGLPIGQQPVNPQTASAPPSSTATTADFGWNTKPQGQQQQPAAQSPVGSTAPMFPLLLSWVLLSGSGAGNLYLFWSYLDVRTKYRDLVYDASRKVGGRRIRD